MAAAEPKHLRDVRPGSSRAHRHEQLQSAVGRDLGQFALSREPLTIRVASNDVPTSSLHIDFARIVSSPNR